MAKGTPLLTPPMSSVKSHSRGEEDLAVALPEPADAGPLAHVGSAGMFTAVSNVVLSVLGAGQLVLPYAMKELGLGVGLTALLLFTALSVHSLHTLTVYELHFTPNPKDCIESYAELVIRVLGKWGNRICALLLALYAWGGALSFMVIVKSELPVLVSLLGLEASAVKLLIADAVFIILPLCSLSDVSLLKKCAPMGCIAAIMVTVVVCCSTPWGMFSVASWEEEACQGPADVAGNVDAQGSAPLGQIRWWPSSFTGVAATLPLLSFALNSSWAYIPILCTLKEKSSRRTWTLINASNAVILANYVLLAFNGYAMFCDRTEANVLDSLEVSSSVWVLIARALVAVQLTLALPMRFFVARRTVGEQLGIGDSALGRAALAFALVASATVLAIMPLSLATVLGITSSVCASMIIYILPSLVDLMLHSKVPVPQSRVRLLGSCISLVVGSFILVAGTLANMLGIAPAAA